MAKISVNELAKFLVSNSAQHRSIVQEQITPNPFKKPYYREARSAISNFLSPPNDENTLIQVLNDLQVQTGDSDTEISRINNNIEAIEQFFRVIDEIEFPVGCTKVQVARPCPKVIVENVEISVSPDAVFAGTFRNNQVIGAVKLYISKESLTDDMGAYIATLAKKFLEENYPNYIVRENFCQVIDVFGKNVYPTPRAYKKRMKEIQAACSELKLWWNALTNHQN